MSDKRKRLVEGFDPEYNPLSKTMKMTLVLDRTALEEIAKTRVEPIKTSEQMLEQVLELLDRSIHLNTPRGMQAGPDGKKW